MMREIVLAFLFTVLTAPSPGVDSSLPFPPLPSSPPPKSETEYDAEGLQPLINVANSFIKTVKDDGLPYDIINKELKKAFTKDSSNSSSTTRRRLLWHLPERRRQKRAFGIQNDFINDLIEYEKEFIIVFGIGIAIAILMILVGATFFCCRMCRHCGGDLVYEGDDERANLKRWLLVIFMVIFLGLATVGCLCAFVTNSRMSNSIGETNSTLSDAIDDIYGFVDNTIDELSFIVNTLYDVVSDRIFEELRTVGETLGVPILNAFRPKVESAVTGVLNMADTVDRVSAILTDVNVTVHSLLASGQQLEAQLLIVNQNVSDLKRKCTARGPPTSTFCNKYIPDSISLEANFSQVPDISGEIDGVNDVLKIDLRSEAKSGNKTFEEIPETVQNETNDATKAVKDDADKFKEDVRGVVKDVSDSAKQVLDDSLGLRSVQKDAASYLEIAEKYDKYRFAAGVSLCLMVLLVIFFGLFGLLLGECNRKSDVLPTDRSRGSNCGGQCLMVSAVLVCVFSFFLLILAAICFAIGANVKVVCDPAENLEFWEKTLDDEANFGYYFLGRHIFNNDSFPLKISDVLRDCDSNSPIYKALKLSQKPEARIAERFDIEEQIPELQRNIDDLKVDINVTILPKDARDNLRDFSDTGIDRINFTAYTAEIEKQLVDTNLTKVVEDLNQLAQDFQSVGEYEFGNSSLEIAGRVSAIDMTTIAPATVVKDKLKVQVDYLRTNASKIQESVDGLVALVDDLEEFLRGNGTLMINASVVEFKDRIIGYVREFANSAVGWIEDDIGKCKNIRVVYDAAVTTFCHYTLDGLNGFWFSIGWSVFFMFFIMILAINLAYHYRRLNHSAGFDSDKMYPKGQGSIRMNQRGSFGGTVVVNHPHTPQY